MCLFQSEGSISGPTRWRDIVLGHWTLELRFYAKNVGLLQRSYRRRLCQVDKLKIKHRESAVVNLDLEIGTSEIGNLPPPLEVQKYFNRCNIEYNNDKVQNTIRQTAGTCAYNFYHVHHNFNRKLKRIVLRLFPTDRSSYELSEIEMVIKQLLHNTDTLFELSADNNTLKCSMFCNETVNFTMPNNIGQLLGFKNHVTDGYTDDCRITQIEYHSFLPYSTSALSNNDGVQITDEIRFINNGLAFLFSEMKYEINGIQIQKLANPGITTTLKGYCSYNKSNITSHHNATWDNDIENVNKDFIESDLFNVCINLKDLFGFCEDYKRILINCNQQLILNRASIDINAIKQYKNNKNDYSKVSDKEKIRLLKVVNNQMPLTCTFRSWELYEYPFLPQNTSHSWKVYLNAEVFPYEDFQCDFTKNKIGTLYHVHTKFQNSYYGHDNVTPLLSRSDFKNLSPIIIVDMNRQNDNVKTPTVDLRIEIETDVAFPASTSAYYLILHDQIITYNPFNGEVRTL
ncbi:Uncharacterized protein FWK35_00020245 [Aphis craccivora]|uniref:Double jelly roll-like domain-containing protein n=1 Tax=Aphis craccivora TaxID=307492 RepID=A0A6G0Y9Z5_APHCR|nr:Uncharacterized protein FWK35_00020245 [Aphis craccivora]